VSGRQPLSHRQDVDHRAEVDGSRKVLCRCEWGTLYLFTADKARRAWLRTVRGVLAAVIAATPTAGSRLKASMSARTNGKDGKRGHLPRSPRLLFFLTRRPGHQGQGYVSFGDCDRVGPARKSGQTVNGRSVLRGGALGGTEMRLEQSESDRTAHLCRCRVFRSQRLRVPWEYRLVSATCIQLGLLQHRSVTVAASFSYSPHAAIIRPDF